MGVSWHVIPICTCIDHDECWILVESYLYVVEKNKGTADPRHQEDIMQTFPI